MARGGRVPGRLESGPIVWKGPAQAIITNDLATLVEEAMQAAQSLKEQRRRDGLAAGAKGPSTLLDDTAPSGRPGTFYSRLGLRQW